MTTILLIFLIVILIGALPNWGLHGGGYSYSGLVGLILVILIVLMITGYIPR